MSLTAQFGAGLSTIRGAICQNTDLVGDFVFIAGASSGGLDNVARADPADYAKMPAIGVIISKSSATRCSVQWFGESPSIFSGLIPGKPVFLDANANATSTPPLPALADVFIQHVGVALSATTAYLTPDDQLTKRIVG